MNPSADNQASSDKSNGDQAPRFEDALRRLEAIVHELEEGDIGLGEALAHYEAGIGLLRQCYGLLERAERRIEMLSGVDAEGNPVTQPFDDTASTAGGDKGPSRSRRRSQPARTAPERPNPPPESEIDSPAGLF